MVKCLSFESHTLPQICPLQTQHFFNSILLDLTFLGTVAIVMYLSVLLLMFSYRMIGMIYKQLKIINQEFMRF